NAMGWPESLACFGLFCGTLEEQPYGYGAVAGVNDRSTVRNRAVEREQRTGSRLKHLSVRLPEGSGATVPRHILVIEDDPHFSAVISDVLQAAGYEVPA